MRQNPFQKRPMPPDQLYQGFDKGLYRITGEESTDNILNMLAAPGATNSQNVQTGSGDIGSGVASSTQNVSTGSMQSGKTKFDNTVTGYILGVDSSDGLPKFYIGTPTSFLNFDGVNVTVAGSLTVTELNIPDSISTDSFHVDSMGNTWWGAPLLANATASVLNTGVAMFANPAVIGDPNGDNLSWTGNFITINGSLDAANGAINLASWTVANLPLPPTATAFKKPTAYA